MYSLRVMGDKRSYVYIVASKRNGTLYLGVTTNLERRIFEHKSKSVPGFTEKYDVTLLVWYGEFSDVRDAIAFEKKLKKLRRIEKIRLIEEANPEWNDLALDWYR